MLLAEKVVLITGAAGSIGTGILRTCRAEGAKLALVDLDLERLKKNTEDLGPEVLRLQADVRDEGQVQAYVEQTVARFGRIDLFCNNAGTTGRRQRLEELDLAAYRAWMDLNLIGMLAGMKYVLRVMYAQKGGCIVNTSSQVAHRPNVGGADYCVQKSAVAMLTKIAALEANGTNVRINCIQPGYVDSQMMRNNFLRFPTLEESIRKNVPLNRMCTPEELGKVVAFLGSDYASYLTGAVIGVDGGHMANFF